MLVPGGNKRGTPPIPPTYIDKGRIKNQHPGDEAPGENRKKKRRIPFDSKKKRK